MRAYSAGETGWRDEIRGGGDVIEVVYKRKPSRSRSRSLGQDEILWRLKKALRLIKGSVEVYVFWVGRGRGQRWEEKRDGEGQQMMAHRHHFVQASSRWGELAVDSGEREHRSWCMELVVTAGDTGPRTPPPPSTPLPPPSLWR